MARLQQLRDEIAGHPWAEVTHGVAVTASIGVAAAPRDAVERSALLALADRFLYQAKHQGRDRVVGSSDKTTDRSEPAGQLASHSVGLD